MQFSTHLRAVCRSAFVFGALAAVFNPVATAAMPAPEHESLNALAVPANESLSPVTVPGDEPLILIAEAELGASRSRALLTDSGLLPSEREAPASAFSNWSAVGAGTLDEMRGGFDMPLQLRLSFGIERAVYVNGALVTTTSFNLPALGGVAPDNPSALSVASGSVSLLQNGPGNTVALSPTAAPVAATIIQNTLNNQSIQGLTTINASANSLELLRSTGFQAVIRDGLSNAVVPH